MKAPRIRVTPMMIAETLAAWVDSGTPIDIAQETPCSGCKDHRAGKCLLNQTRAVMAHLLKQAGVSYCKRPFCSTCTQLRELRRQERLMGVSR